MALLYELIVLRHIFPEASALGCPMTLSRITRLLEAGMYEEL